MPLGKMLAEGIGVKRDRGSAFEQFKKAAEQKHPKQPRGVAKIYENGEQAVAFYTEAAEGGVPGAQYARWERRLPPENPVPVDLVKSSKYYRAAADQGDLKAQITLLKIFFRHPQSNRCRRCAGADGVPAPAPADIFKYAQNAAEKSEPLGQYYLGMPPLSTASEWRKTQVLKPLPGWAKPQGSRQQRLHDKVVRNGERGRDVQNT